METFQILSRGGVKFNKKRFKQDVNLFTSKEQVQTNTLDLASAVDESLPPELDFFKYSQGQTVKRKDVIEKDEVRENKRQKVETGEPGPSTVKHRVTLKSSGAPIPESIESFECLTERYQTPPRLLDNLRNSGYMIPTAIQSQGIPILLEGHDLAAISPTGTGKTLSYLIPIFSSLKSPITSLDGKEGSGVRALVIAPTRELAHQIYNECLKLAQGRKWKIVLFSKATASSLSDREASSKQDIIVSTPLRLVASLQTGALHLNNVRHLVLDEADRLLDQEFISQTREIIAACTHDLLRKTVFSATLPAGVEKIAMEILRNPVRVVVGLKDTPLPSISQSLTYVADESSKLPTLLQHLSGAYSPPVIVFTSTQPRASSLAEQLILNNIQNVDCLHAGMSRKERDDAVARMKSGESWVMVTTEVMARGIDFRGVQGVINFDFPPSVQSYIHRIGRTGRAGREGTAITYFTDEDAPFLKPIANVLLQSGSTVPEWISKLPKPSKMKRKLMGKVERGEAVTKDGRIGRNEAVKKRQMIEGSKRRKLKDRTSSRAPNEEP